MLPTTPRGVNTSELWLVVAAIVLSVARAVATACGLHFSPGADAQLNIATALPAIYAAARTYLKVHVPTVGNALPDLGNGAVAAQVAASAPSSPSLDPATIPNDVTHPSLADSTPPATAAGDTPTQTVPTTLPDPMLATNA